MDVGIHQKINIIRSLFAPLPLVKKLNCGLEKSQPLTVKYHSMKLLILLWKKSKTFLPHFKSHETLFKKTVVHPLLNVSFNFLFFKI